jgi:surfactin synthase thioesterase subunit
MAPVVSVAAIMMTGLRPTASTDKLLPFSAGKLAAGLPLFCLPSAGGGAVLFRNWLGGTGTEVAVHPLELPGRGARTGEPAAADLPAFAAELAAEMRQLLSRPFAIFGHSCGAMLGFELATQLTRCGIEPVHLFVSACRPPNASRGAPLHRLDDGRLVQRLRDLAGIPDAVLREPEMIAHFLPIIRADLRRLEEYRHGPDAGSLCCPVTAMAGTEDPHVSADEMEEWCHFTSGRFRCARFPGGHFFIRSQQHEVLRMIRQSLAGPGTQR